MLHKLLEEVVLTVAAQEGTDEACLMGRSGCLHRRDMAVGVLVVSSYLNVQSPDVVSNPIS